MIFKLKTSKKTAEIFDEIGRSASLKPYTLVKHAIAWSVKEGGAITKFNSDSNGLELNRQTITGEYDVYYKVLIEQLEGKHLSDDEYFPKYLKAHIDRGALILESHYKHAGNLDKYVLETLGVGDTV
ncbi:MAG: DndE family protein [Prevotella sp.]|nr:DndE family protein [Prevotella sp.]